MRPIGASKKLTLLVWASLLLAPAGALAQVGIAGRVADATGAVVPGVTVEAASPALIEKVRVVTTDGQGLYNIVNLPPGVYTVTFTLPGFAAFKKEGLELSGTFVATVNAEMRVSGVEETITVSGQGPVVDVTSVMRNEVMTRQVIDSLPTGRTFQNFAAVIPGMQITAIVRMSGQDVGGSENQGSHLLTIHGSRSNDMQNLIEGVPNNNSNSFGFQGMYLDAGSMEEYNYHVGSVPAEIQTGGVHVNFVPKSGSNRFSARFYADYTNDSLNTTNITDALRDRGVTTANKMLRIFDVNPGFGGPIKRDRVWFFASGRLWGQDMWPADSYYNKTPGTLTYTPDLRWRAIDDNWIKSASVRPTWQMTPKNKLNGYFVLQTRCLCHNNVNSLTPPEATPRAISPNSNFEQVLWTSTLSNRLLFEAGMSRLLFDQTFGFQRGVTPDVISALDLATGFRYRAPGAATRTIHGPVYNWKAALSYVTGSHNFKGGFTLQKNQRERIQTINGDMVLNLLNGVPTRVELFTTPATFNEELFPMLGVFAQDQWTVKQLTLTAGVRVDYHHAFVPEQNLPPVRFVGARNFAKVEDVPKWLDISPRLGASYDLFGNGKTALKVAINRYVNGELFSGITSQVNPVQTSVNTATRAWTDINGNFLPDCDFSNPALNGECGPISNVNFGKVVVRTRFDEDYTKGFAKREFNWETMVGVQHELVSQVAVNVNYYRRRYGNFLATRNTLVSPAEFDPYCITAPVDSRLPGGDGKQICGFFDVTPSKFGQVDNLVTFAKNFGKQTDIYNGVDLTVNARLPRRATVSGGLNIGRQATNNCGVVLTHPDIDYPGSASGVLAPRSEPFCNTRSPFQAQVKLQATYPLPWWDLQASGTFQSVPGPEITAVYTARNAEVVPTLGRNLAAGANGSVRVDLIPRGTLYDTRLYQTDFRLSKILRVGPTRLQGNFDIYNAFNGSAVLARNNVYGPAWGRVLQVLGARLYKFGIQVDF